MSSQPNTQRRAAPPRGNGAPQPVAPPDRGGLDVGTLVVAAISAVAAATVVSRLWQAGTVWATAMTPVIVTVIREALDRPAKRVSSIASRAAPPLARATRAVAEPPPEAYAPPPPVGPDPGLTEMRVYRRERATGRRWKLALATGLLAFVIGVAVMTLPELVAGRSVVSGTHHTTIFGGHRAAPSSKASPAETKKTTTDESTTTTDTQPQDTTTQPDTTTTAPDGQTPTTTEPTQPAPTAPAPTQPAPTQTQPPAQTQPPPATP
jgi:hypothetical protein